MSKGNFRKLVGLMFIAIGLFITACGYYPVAEKSKWYCKNTQYEINNLTWVISNDGVNGTIDFTLKNLNEFPYQGIELWVMGDGNRCKPFEDRFVIESLQESPRSYNITTACLRKAGLYPHQDSMLDIVERIRFTPLVEFEEEGATITTRCAHKFIEKTEMAIE